MAYLRRFTGVILLSIVSLAANASGRMSEVRVFPAEPTNVTPVTIGLWGAGDTICDEIADPVAVIAGSEIEISVKDIRTPGFCNVFPGSWEFEVDLGVLPAGDYTLTVRGPFEARQPVHFQVRDVTTFEPRPLGVPANAVRFRLQYTDRVPKRAWLGGVEATVVGGEITACAGCVPEGWTDLRVEFDDGLILSAANSLLVYDLATGSAKDAYERVLIPIFYNGAGAHATKWESSLRVGGPPGTVYDDSITEPDDSQVALGDPARIGQRPGGFFLHLLPQARAEFGLFFRETTRGTPQTSIPVVRERDFRHDGARLLGVSFEGDRRVTLRLYAVDRDIDTFSVGVSASDRFLDGNVVPSPGADDEPAFASIDLTAWPRHPAGLADVSIATSPEGRRFWAMITVTDNNTQFTTVITP
jgi:hypothetical protein